MIGTEAIAKGKLRKKSKQFQDIFALESLSNDQYSICRITVCDTTVMDISNSDCFLAESSSELLQKLNYSIGEQAVLILPRHLAIFKTVRIPSIDPIQISKMLPHEIRPLMPWPEEECIWGYSIEQKGEDGYSTVLISILNRDTVVARCEQLASMGIALTHVCLSTYALQTLSLSLEDVERPAMLYIGEGVSEYVRFSDDRIEFSRGVNSGTDAHQVLNESIALDERKNGSDSIITSLTTIEQSSSGNEFMVSELSSTPILPIEQIPLCVHVSQLTSRNALSVGASLRILNCFPEENLLPEFAQQVWQRKRLWVSVRHFALSLMCLIGVVSFLGWYYIQSQQSLIEETRLEIEQLTADVGDLDTQIKELQQLIGNNTAISTPLKVVLELYERTPSNIAINFYRYSDSGDIVMGGEAPTMDAVWAFVEAMQNSPLLIDVEMNHLTKPKNGQSLSVDFRLTCRVNLS